MEVFGCKLFKYPAALTCLPPPQNLLSSIAGQSIGTEQMTHSRRAVAGGGDPEKREQEGGVKVGSGVRP